MVVIATLDLTISLEQVQPISYPRRRGFYLSMDTLCPFKTASFDDPRIRSQQK